MALSDPTRRNVKEEDMLAQCPICSWSGIKITKAGKLTKHGRIQTGAGGRSCAGSGMPWSEISAIEQAHNDAWVAKHGPTTTRKIPRGPDGLPILPDISTYNRKEAK